MNNVALTLYTLGTTKYGHDVQCKHTACNNTEEHDKLLASLYNNISIVYFRDQNYVDSLHYAKTALKFNKQHVSCVKRIAYIIKHHTDN